MKGLNKSPTSLASSNLIGRLLEAVKFLSVAGRLSRGAAHTPAATCGAYKVVPRATVKYNHRDNNHIQKKKEVQLQNVPVLFKLKLMAVITCNAQHIYLLLAYGIYWQNYSPGP